LGCELDAERGCVPRAHDRDHFPLQHVGLPEYGDDGRWRVENGEARRILRLDGCDQPSVEFGKRLEFRPSVGFRRDAELARRTAAARQARCFVQRLARIAETRDQRGEAGRPDAFGTCESEPGEALALVQHAPRHHRAPIPGSSPRTSRAMLARCEMKIIRARTVINAAHSVSP
jgi:hypothetical protein